MIQYDNLMIPIPANLNLKDGKFVLSKNTKIHSTKSVANLKHYFISYFSENFGVTLESSKEYLIENSINFKLDDTLIKLGPEGYELTITDEHIDVRSSGEAGIFYGIQTIKQLLPQDLDKSALNQEYNGAIPCLIIEDFPRFNWRGFMFDVGRHFHSIDTIKRILDLISLLKMNVFHWHLTEDQGWRIEIKKYPQLTEIGSKRKDSKVGGWTSKKYRGKPHEGFYSQEQIKEIVQYAKERFITIVPEIEMPGHSSAAIASYPKVSCKNENIDVPIKFGIFSDVFCPGKEITFEFLINILDEVLDLFPSEIIHIGGDEVPKKNWKSCSDCKERMEKEGLKKLKELHSYFTKRISDYLKSNGRRTIGWNEILDEKTDASVIGQFWAPTGKKQVLKHIRKGGEIIVSNFFRYYLDYNYFVTPLRKTYNFDPIPKGLKKEYYNQIMGVEAPIWTEWVPNTDRLDWQVFPRLAAVAETAWALEQNKNYRSFVNRLGKFNQILDSMDVKYATLDKVNPKGVKRFINLRRALKWPDV